MPVLSTRTAVAIAAAVGWTLLAVGCSAAEPPPDAAEIAPTIPDVRAEGAPGYTELDIDAASLELVTLANSAMGGDFEAMAYFDSRDGSFHVEVAPVDPAATDARAAAEKVAALIPLLSGSNPLPQIPVVAAYIADPVVDEE